MVTYGGMSKKPITVSTSSFIFKVHVEDIPLFFGHAKHYSAQLNFRNLIQKDFQRYTDILDDV